MDTSRIKKIGVVGAGGWGTALSVLAADAGCEVVIWGREEDVAESINSANENTRFLPGVKLPEAVVATTDIGGMSDCDLLLVVVPSSGMRPVMGMLSEVGIRDDVVLVTCAKGIEKESGERMTEVIRELFPANPVAVLSGPNHAEEVGLRLAAAAVIGCEDMAIAEALQRLLGCGWFRFYTSTDVAGIEWSGAVKNVFAVSAGIANGLGLGDNAKAALVTRGLAEMVRIGTAHGAQAETFQGLSGVGDLIVTCYSEHSRNNRLGNLLGSGSSIEEALAQMKSVPEGLPNAESIYLASQRKSVRTPLIDAAYAVLYGGRDAREVLAELLARDPRPEVD